MKILYLTASGEDYLADGILYGLRMKYGADVVDYPKKWQLYEAKGNRDIYGRGFTLYGNLEDIEIDRDSVWDDWNDGKFDLTVLSSIYRQQFTFTDYRNFGIFKGIKTKWAFIDGEDDGFPCVVDATHFGAYFKRENPFNYPGVRIVGMSIPESKMLTNPPVKTKTFTTHVQCREAYLLQEVMDNCTEHPVFTSEGQYYHDLSTSRYGVTMKKSGWDVPRHIENAAHYVVNCIYSRGWDNTLWYDKLAVHPLDLEDMKNCIIWDDYEELGRKVSEANKHYEEISSASREWAKTKTCEAMTDYFLNNL